VRRRVGVAFALVGALALAACQRAADEPQPTRFPGQISAGGGTSGSVMAAAKPMDKAMREAGTPGIPQGAGGNTAGAKLGGSTGSGALANSGEQTAAQRVPGTGAPAHDGAAASAPQTAAATAAAGGAAASAPAAAAAPASAASVPAAEAAARQKQLLDESMTRVAQHWRERAAQQGWPVQPAPPASGAK
jgi:hypothetical protein